jgi:hypothetical protein
MHTFEHDDVRFNFSPDLSGPVYITAGLVAVQIDGEALLRFLAHLADEGAADSPAHRGMGLAAQMILRQHANERAPHNGEM